MNKSAYELIKLVTAVKQEIPNITVPFLCLHGEKDLIALPKGSTYLMEHSGTAPSLKSINIFPGLRHEIFREKTPDGPNSIQCVLKYFESMTL